MPNASDLGTFNEKITVLAGFRITNELGVGLAPGDLDTLTLTIYEEISLAIVNSVNGTNIKNTGRGALDAQGNLTITWLPADLTCLTTMGREVHVNLIQWTYPSGTGAKAGRHEARMTVLNLAKVS